jgi:RNA polymerase sigma-70 factor (ECF subfamily)
MSDDSSGCQTRPSLLLRLRDASDREAWKTFVEVYGPLVVDQCARKGLQPADADDVTQCVFARIVRSILTFEYRPEVGRFRAWFGTIIRNEIYRFLKQETAQVRGAGENEAGNVLDDVAARVEDTAWETEFNAHLLRTALARSRPHFEEVTWRAFERVWLENRPVLEVAAELGRTIDWVYMAKSRVLKHLWQEVQELADDSAVGQLFP